MCSRCCDMAVALEFCFYFLSQGSFKEAYWCTGGANSSVAVNFEGILANSFA